MIRFGLVVAVVVGFGAIGAAAAAARSSSNDPAPDRTQTYQVTAPSNDPSYWTRDRMASARPAPLPVDPADPAGAPIQPTNGPTPPVPAGPPTH
jgi:hypothetical protein